MLKFGAFLCSVFLPFMCLEYIFVKTPERQTLCPVSGKHLPVVLLLSHQVTNGIFCLRNSRVSFVDSWTRVNMNFREDSRSHWDVSHGECAAQTQQRPGWEWCTPHVTHALRRNLNTSQVGASSQSHHLSDAAGCMDARTSHLLQRGAMQAGAPGELCVQQCMCAHASARTCVCKGTRGNAALASSFGEELHETQV